MFFGETEIVVKAVDETSGTDCSVKLSFLERSLDSKPTVIPDA